MGKQFLKNKPNHPPGVSAEYIASQKAKKEAEIGKSTIPGMPVQNETKKKKKKTKNKSSNALAEDMAAVKISEPASTSKTKNSNNPTKSQPPASSRQDATGASHLSDSMKRLKNLRKKYREIEVLEQKLKDGVIKNPDQEMIDKVSRKNEVREEIQFLESNQ